MRMTLRCVTRCESSSSCLEAVDDGRILGQLRTDHLQRDHSVEFQIARLVDRAHAAFA